MASHGTEKRRLAAIMFTDMVGYTALTQRNEDLSLALLEEHRQLLRLLFPNFNGTEVKTIGDGFLVEFPSALEAAQCAIEIQRTLARRNTDCSPDRQIQVRIGIHLGDVVHREGDVYGDGINIASRIEPLAGPGGICMSMDVERQIRHALQASLVKLPPAELKNIKVPMDLFRIVLPWTSPSPVALSHSKSRAYKAPLAIAAFVFVVLCGVLLSFHYFSSRPPTPIRTHRTNSPLPLAVAGAPKSVAVLPFLNLSSDKENEYLSDGITDDLCTALTQIKGLRVPARTSCFVFKGKTEDIQRIGQQLRVATVLEGSVSKAGNKLRINAQLVNIADGFHLWATNYDREMSDLLDMRSEIVQRVVAALRVQLLPSETLQLETKPTVNPEAHRLYLLGRFFWNRRTEEDLRKAVNYLQQALDQDTNYALANAGLADCYLVLPEYAGLSKKEVSPKARAATQRALELDNTLGEAHVDLAILKKWDWDWAGAEAAFKDAINLSPNYATAHHWYSIFLREMGRLEEGSREIYQARELDPLSPVINVNVGDILYSCGRYDQAIAEQRKVLELNPNFPAAHVALAQTYLMKGMFNNAIHEFQMVRTLVGNSPYRLGVLGYAYAASGQTSEARKVLNELMHFLERGYEVQYDVALVYHGLQDNNQTLEWLEKALNKRVATLGELNWDPVWHNMSSDPKFIGLLSEMGVKK